MEDRKNYINIPSGAKINAKFAEREVTGELKIGNRTFNVYLRNMEICNTEVFPFIGKEQLKHKFILIEV